jgi:hypothetical protein
MAEKTQIVVPQDATAVDENRSLMRQWMHFFTNPARLLNDLRARVEALEKK